MNRPGLRYWIILPVIRASCYAKGPYCEGFMDLCFTVFRVLKG
jgi:hypothetical protein